MQILDKWERRFGKFAINGLMRYVVACYIIGYVIYYIQPSFLSWLTLEPVYIFQGAQIWRLVSWLLMPPSNTNIIFVVIMLILYYQLGSTLERTWGAFRFNLFIIGDVIISIIVALLMYLIGYYGFHKLIFFGSSFSTFYINMSIFLAFSVAFPDQRIMLYFFIPIKMKWMGLVYAVLMVYEFIAARYMPARVAIVASMATFLIYFLGSRNLRRFSPHEVKRKRDFKQQVNAGRTQNAKFRDADPVKKSRTGSRNTGSRNAGSRSGASRGGSTNVYAPKNNGKTPIHKCAICGRTELDDPNLTFRYCSKCNGNYEYCQDHLFTHKHII